MGSGEVTTLYTSRDQNLFYDGRKVLALFTHTRSSVRTTYMYLERTTSSQSATPTGWTPIAVGTHRSNGVAPCSSF